MVKSEQLFKIFVAMFFSQLSNVIAPLWVANKIEFRNNVYHINLKVYFLYYF